MKSVLFIFLLLMSFASWSKVFHVVFDLEGSLVVSVPQRIVSASSSKSSFLSVSEGGKTVYYRIYPYAMAALESLMNQDSVIVHIFSNKDQNVINSIMGLIPTQLTKDSNLLNIWNEQGAGKIFDKSKLDITGKFDLRNVTSDVKNVIFFTRNNNSLISSQLSNQVLLPNHYFYETFAQLTSEKTNLMKGDDWLSKHAPYFPQDEAEWNKSNMRMVIIHEKIFAINKDDSSKPLLTAWKEQSDSTALESGSLWVKSNYTNKVLTWKVSNNQANGCQFIDIRTQKKSNTLTNVECVEKLPTYSYYLGKTNNCQSFTENLEIIDASKNCKKGKYAILDGDQNKYVIKGLYQFKFDLNQFNSGRSIVDGVTLPRTDQTFYRGMSLAQYDLSKALRALFGDDYAGVESKNLTAFKFYINNMPSPINVDYSYRNFSAELDKVRGQSKDINTAKDMAISIMDEKLSALTYTQKRDNYVLYTSGTYQDWSADLVFGSVHYGAANGYGDVIVAYRDIYSRGVDLNWSNRASRWAGDLGEYVTPIEIRPEEIIGFQQRSLGESFFKINFEGEDFVLVIESNSCLNLKDQSQLVYSCSFTTYGKYSPLPTNIYHEAIKLTTVAPVKAILGLCGKSKNCTLPDGLIQKYNPSGSPLSSGTKAIIDDFSFGNKKIKVYQ